MDNAEFILYYQVQVKIEQNLYVYAIVFRVYYLFIFERGVRLEKERERNANIKKNIDHPCQGTGMHLDQE